MFSDQDKRMRLIRRLSKLESQTIPDSREIYSLINTTNYTQAFLTQWMAVEKTTKHISKVGVICIWCEKAFESLHKSLGDIGYSQQTLEKRMFDTLYTRYAESRATGIEKINIDQFKKALNALGVSYGAHELTVLLASKADNHSSHNDWPNHKKQTIRKVRNNLIHNDGRITNEEYDAYLPYFEKYFSIIIGLKEQIDSFTTMGKKE